MSPTPCKIVQKFYWAKVSSFNNFPLPQLLPILLYNISFVDTRPPGPFFRLYTVRHSLYKIFMSKIYLSFQNIETMEFNFFIKVLASLIIS